MNGPDARPTAEAGRIGSAAGYRLVCAFVALLLLAALLVYRRVPERRVTFAAPVAQDGMGVEPTAPIRRVRR